MNRFIKARVDEHKDLLIRIAKLEEVIANWNKVTNFNPSNTTRSHVTYANVAILLASYKKAAEAVECILENEGVTLGEDGCYREVIDKVKNPINIYDDEDEDEPKQQQGSDNDIDKEK